MVSLRQGPRVIAILSIARDFQSQLYPQQVYPYQSLGMLVIMERQTLKPRVVLVVFVPICIVESMESTTKVCIEPVVMYALGVVSQATECESIDC